MKYAKLIDNTVVFAPNPILRDGFFIGNPTSAIYLSEGFKPVSYTNQPEPQGRGWYESIWMESEEAIVQDWEWRESDSEVR